MAATTAGDIGDEGAGCEGSDRQIFRLASKLCELEWGRTFYQDMEKKHIIGENPDEKIDGGGFKCGQGEGEDGYSGSDLNCKSKILVCRSTEKLALC